MLAPTPTPLTTEPIAGPAPTVRHATVAVPPRARRNPSAHTVATRLATAFTDVLATRRPSQQVRSRMTPAAFGKLMRQLAGTSRSARDFRVQSVHACLTTQRSIEATAVLAGATRSRALALRIEHRDGQWVCSALSLL